MQNKFITLAQQELTERNNVEQASKRICGLDLIRVCAIFFVIAGHFFSLNTSFRVVPFVGLSMFVQSMMNTLFSVGVPLFMMLTGYLNVNKKPVKAYYKGMMRVIVAYILFSVITILFRVYYLGDEYSIVQWILRILNYSAIPYAWYIEMWIGLALLTPFLNYLYKAIPSINEKLLLIASLFIMTSLPDLCNRYGLYIFPAYFASACYPLLFFFIGTFIREYQPRINIWLGCSVIVSMCLITPIANVILFRGSGDIVEIGGGPGGVFYTWIAVALFLMLYKTDISMKPLRKFFTHCSSVSLEMYLCCFVFDQIYYSWFRSHLFYSQSQFLVVFFVVVPLVFFSSYAIASLYNWCVGMVKKLLVRR